MFAAGVAGYQNQASASKGGGGVICHFMVTWKLSPPKVAIFGNLGILDHTHPIW